MPAVADDLADIRALNTHRGGKCELCKLLAIGAPELVATVTEALADNTIEGKAIWRWLNERKGISVGYDSVLRHRRGDCLGSK